MNLALLATVFLSVFCLGLTDDVLDLSGQDFEDRVKEHEAVLVEFFAPWCGHCKRLAPEYEKAATTLKDNDPPVPLAKVDCTSDAGKETCSKYGVSGYPTLKIFRHGEFSSEYNGPREAVGIAKYMKAQVGPSSKDLSSVADAKKFLEKEETIIFGFFKDQSSSLRETFKKIADKQRETALFCHSFDEGVMKEYGYKDQIVLFRPKRFQSKFEEKEVKYDGSDDSTVLEKFISQNYHGLVGHRTQDNHQLFPVPVAIAYYNVDYVKNTKGTNYWRNRILKVAQSFKGKFTFAISNKNDFAGEMDEFGLDSKSEKPVVSARDSKSRKFRMTDEFSPENLEKFLNDVLDGTLKPHLKSEALPESNDGPVKVAVAENFDSLVNQADKDTLIEFYAPWCGHCKKLAPTFEELGKELEDETEVQIVKMDATANDVPPTFQVQGFPTLFWVSKEDKENPKKYEGGRELTDFVQYIAKHSTNELKGYDRSGKKKPEKTEL